MAPRADAGIRTRYGALEPFLKGGKLSPLRPVLHDLVSKLKYITASTLHFFSLRYLALLAQACSPAPTLERADARAVLNEVLIDRHEVIEHLKAICEPLRAHVRPALVADRQRLWDGTRHALALESRRNVPWNVLLEAGTLMATNINQTLRNWPRQQIKYLQAKEKLSKAQARKRAKAINRAAKPGPTQHPTLPDYIVKSVEYDVVFVLFQRTSTGHHARAADALVRSFPTRLDS